MKLRSSQVRSARARIISIVAGISLGAVLGVYLLWRIGGWTLDQLVYENKSFAIVQLDVQTDGVISPDQLRRWSGVKPGENLLALNLADVQRALELVPMIQSASVERILPETLRIRVTERVPVAQVNVPRPRSGGGIELVVYQVDANGYVVLPLDPRQRAVPLSQSADELPVISGINISELQPGRRVDSAQVQGALQLVTAFESSGLSGVVELKRVDVSAAGVLVAYTGQGSEVTLSLENFDQQLLRWQKIHEECMKLNKVIATLDLAVPENTPLRFLEASTVPPSPPRPARTPPRNRRRNV